MTERDFVMKMKNDLRIQKQEASCRVKRAEEALRHAKEDYDKVFNRLVRMPNANNFNEDELLNM